MGTFVGGALVAIGVALILVAGIGLFRLPDAYNRMNAVAKASSLGVILILAGTVVLMPSTVAAVKTAVAIVMQLLTAAVGGFAIARAAYRTGAPLASVTRFDELGEHSNGAGEE